MHSRKDPRIKPGPILPPIVRGHKYQAGRSPCDRLRSTDAWMCQMYQRTMALWAFDLLAHRPAAVWLEEDPVCDRRDRNWLRLYEGSILDD